MKSAAISVTRLSVAEIPLSSYDVFRESLVSIADNLASMLSNLLSTFVILLDILFKVVITVSIFSFNFFEVMLCFY